MGSTIILLTVIVNLSCIFCTIGTFDSTQSVHSLDREGTGACQDALPYDRCSFNSICGCLPLANSQREGLCTSLHIRCSELISCANDNQTCYQPGYRCVEHSRCQSTPVCYPINTLIQTLCPSSMTTTPQPTPIVPGDGICASATWNPNGVTIAGGNGRGPELNQLNSPLGLFVDNNGIIYIADNGNRRVMKWILGISNGQVVAGDNGKGNEQSQLNAISKVVVNKNDTMFICDYGNRRVLKWFLNDLQGETIISNMSCGGLAMDNDEILYVTDTNNHLIIKWPSNQIVAGGNGQGAALNQFATPTNIFIDSNRSIFVADSLNNRIIKWPMGAKEGIIVAGGNEMGDDNNQLSELKYSKMTFITGSLLDLSNIDSDIRRQRTTYPNAVVVDDLGTIYVADLYNFRIMRWFQGSKSGNFITGGLDPETNQPLSPSDLAFDRQGNLYVADFHNNRILMFTIDKSSCV